MGSLVVHSSARRGSLLTQEDVLVVGHLGVHDQRAMVVSAGQASSAQSHRLVIEDARHHTCTMDVVSLITILRL